MDIPVSIICRLVRALCNLIGFCLLFFRFCIALLSGLVNKRFYMVVFLPVKLIASMTPLCGILADCISEKERKL